MFAAVEWKGLKLILFRGDVYVFVAIGVLRKVDAASRVDLVKDARVNG